MTEFKAGQRVRVEWEGVVERQSSETILVVQASEGHSLFIDPTKDIKVTLLDPPGWPPRVGDIWEADGKEWFGWKSNAGTVGLKADNGYVRGSGNGWSDFKALNPVLVRRRGQ